MSQQKIFKLLREAINSGLKTAIDKQNEVNVLRDKISNELNVSTDLFYNNWPDSGPALRLASIKTPKEKRNQGLGTKAMNMIIQYADKNGMKIFLTPVTDWGSSKARLINFYKSFGFIKNSGKNKDWHYKEDMVRLPNNLNSESLLEVDLMKYNSNEVNYILDKFGISSSNELGSGTYGIAFNYGSHLVLKITTDSEEAIFANNIKNKKFERISEIQNVYKIKKGELFIIILEKLQPINDEEINEILRDMHIIHDSYIVREEKYSNFKEFLEEKIKEGNWFNPDIQNLISTMPIEKIIWTFNEYDAILNELNTAKGIPDGFSDLHYDNMGLKNGKLAVYDIRVVDYKKWKVNKIPSYK